MCQQLVYLNEVLCVSFHCSYLNLDEVFWPFVSLSQQLLSLLQQVILRIGADVVAEIWERFVSSE